MNIVDKIRKMHRESEKKKTRKLISKTLKKEDKIAKERVKTGWQERKVAAMKTEREIKARQKALRKEEFDLKYGPAIRTAKSIGRGLVRTVKATERASRKGKALGGIINRMGANIRKLEASDRRAARVRPPDPYHSRSAEHYGNYNAARVDSALLNKVRRTRGG